MANFDPAFDKMIRNEGVRVEGTVMQLERIEMAKKKKLCEICGENPATVPDRERMGRLINRVCSSCHALRLAGDTKLIFELHERRRQAQLGHNAPHERTAFGGALENTVMQEDLK